ncbi:hypothetical protein [Curtobacterium sp. MCBA15_013]|uniref:hypothetical protein n=1 Tax=Curtobacterium sp. MCBA15_013 TaxID=1898739 RepID=UPI0008DE0248|nr:hypothetical protein [Curtobacterium sp. MCBA15_013]OII16622.1 hypothetical protein BIV01_05940 [Curtobacterium sp. MCBA15_013]
METALVTALIAAAAAMRRAETQSEYDISRTVLERLMNVPWAPKPDRNLARRALRRHRFERIRDREQDAD